MQESIPAMGAAWSRNNQIYLGGAALDTYHLFTNFPVNSIDDLKGRKIMAPGPSANWIKGTGAVAVASALPQYYNNIKTGVADGVLTFATGAFAIKLHEVAPYITKVNIGSQYAGGISINRDRWEEFPEEVRQAFREAADGYTKLFAEQQAAKAGLFMKKMEEMGAKVSELSPAERARWANTIPNAAKAWAAKLESGGLPGETVLAAYMKALQDAGVKLPRDWSKE
jgi:TRAP-type C4-dicarboxylate transport system substrate-binding protein